MQIDKPQKTTAMTLRLDRDLKVALLKLALAEDRSLSNYITKVLRTHVAHSK
jgi:predicted transcriptional regulator